MECGENVKRVSETRGIKGELLPAVEKRTADGQKGTKHVQAQLVQMEVKKVQNVEVIDDE